MLLDFIINFSFVPALQTEARAPAYLIASKVFLRTSKKCLKIKKHSQVSSAQ